MIKSEESLNQEIYKLSQLSFLLFNIEENLVIYEYFILNRKKLFKKNIIGNYLISNIFESLIIKADIFLQKKSYLSLLNINNNYTELTMDKSEIEPELKKLINKYKDIKILRSNLVAHHPDNLDNWLKILSNLKHINEKDIMDGSYHEKFLKVLKEFVWDVFKIIDMYSESPAHIFKLEEHNMRKSELINDLPKIFYKKCILF